jgi:hypothetical protein
MKPMTQSSQNAANQQPLEPAGQQSLLADIHVPQSPSAKGKIKATSTAWYRQPAGVLVSKASGAVGGWISRRLPSVHAKRAAMSIAVMLLAGGAAYGAAMLMPKSEPDVFADDLADVLDYTLVSEEFNKLPIEQRLKLLQEVIARLKGADSQDSAMVAAFAAGLTGPMRAQLMRNAEKLAVDVWDKFASEYATVPVGERDAYLDKAFVDFTNMMEEIAGLDSGVDEGQRMERARRDMQRGTPRDMPPMDAGRAAGLVQWMNDRAGKYTTPMQQANMASFARDMSRRMSGVQTPTSGGQPSQPSQPAQPGQR